MIKMKNKIKGLLLFTTTVFSLAANREDAEIPDHGPVTQPQEEIKGTYTGEWTRQEEGTDNVTTAPGTAVFTPADANYTTTITAKCDDMSIDMTSVANITPGGEGYMFHNTVATNGFGAIFQGTVKKSDMSVWFSFKKTVREGRKTYTYIYDFNGVHN